MPFLTLWTLKTVDSPSIRTALVAAAFFVLAALSSGYYAVSATILVVLILAWHAGRGLGLAHLKPLLAFAGASLGAILAITWPVLREALAQDSALANSQHARFFSSDLVSFVLPSRFNPLYDGFVADAYGRLVTYFTEWESYLGAVAVALAAVGVYRSGLRRTGLWLAVLVVFAVLSMGPYLQVVGKQIEAVPMPFRFLQDLPVFDAMRYPKRFLVTGMLALAVLSGHGAHQIFSLSWARPRVYAYWVTLLLAGLILTDFWGWPRTFVTSDATVPRFFRDLAAETHEPVLLHIPLPGIFNPKPLFYQTVHGKRIVGGYVERPTPEATEDLRQNRFLRGAVLPGIEDKVSLTRRERSEGEAFLAAHPEIEYVVLSKSHFFYPRLKSFDVYSAWLQETFGLPYYEDSLIAVYSMAGTVGEHRARLTPPDRLVSSHGGGNWTRAPLPATAAASSTSSVPSHR